MDFAGLYRQLRGYWLDERTDMKIPALLIEVERAKKDWIFAQSYFREVTDEDLIEYAAYAIKAAEKKYLYLLKQARRQKIKGSFCNTTAQYTS